MNKHTAQASMADVETRAIALSTAPAGCAFLLAMERYGLSAQEAAGPAVSMHLAAEAVSLLTPWDPDHDDVVAAKLAHGPRLLGLARSVLSQPGASWWFGPLQRTTQEWISRSGAPPDPGRLVTPVGPPTAFERSAQKPVGGLFTSTGAEGTSSALALLTDGYGDYQLEPPLIRYGLRGSLAARVFEVDGPRAWYRLCAAYPSPGDDGRLVPDWGVLAGDWDAVHLTLGGLLTAEQVRVDGPEGWAEHSGWDAEQTAWLRWRFDAVERLPDLPALPRSPVHASWPPTPRESR